MKSFLRIIAATLVVTFLFGSFTTVSAVEDQFEIDLTVTGAPDVTAPSVPTSLTATAVSSSQIDLSWTASTDDVAVTGYRIYRDNNLVTTIAGVSYSDTGLSASTLYEYVVSAIDAASNESIRSATSSATTFAIPASSGGSGGGSGQYVYPVIYDVSVLPGETNAVISWKTTQPTLGTVAWGLTSNLEQGLVSETSYTTDHQITLGNLLSGTEYIFSIDVLSGYGLTVSIPEARFTTNPVSEYGVNASAFKAAPETNSILLSWRNPTSAFFDEVRIVRSEGFYPSSPSDGTTIYEGGLQEFRDNDVVSGKRYYYALFARDTAGEYSSGLLSSARIAVPGEPAQEIPPVFEELPQAPAVHPVIQSLSFADFDFIQGGKKVATLSGKNVAIDGAKNLTVSLDYGRVPEILKSIVVTLRHPSDSTKIFSFLLRVNEEKSAYVATIGPLGDSGTYGVDIAIVDYKNQGLKKIVGNLFASVGVAYEGAEGFFSVILAFILDRILFFLLLIILFLLILKALQLIFGKNRRSFVRIR